MFQKLLNPQGTWSNTVQYKRVFIGPALAIGGGYTSVPMVIYNSVSYYAIVDQPTIGSSPDSDSEQWTPMSITGEGTGNVVGSGTTTVGQVPMFSNTTATGITGSYLSFTGTAAQISANTNGFPVSFLVTNTSNTAGSVASISVLTAGTTAANPFYFVGNSALGYSFGLDNSVGNGAFVISPTGAITPGTGIFIYDYTNNKISLKTAHLALGTISYTVPTVNTNGVLTNNSGVLTWGALPSAGKYSASFTTTGGIYMLPASTHGLGAFQNLLVQTQDSSGNTTIWDTNVDSAGNITITDPAFTGSVEISGVITIRV